MLTSVLLLMLVIWRKNVVKHLQTGRAEFSATKGMVDIGIY